MRLSFPSPKSCDILTLRTAAVFQVANTLLEDIVLRYFAAERQLPSQRSHLFQLSPKSLLRLEKLGTRRTVGPALGGKANRLHRGRHGCLLLFGPATRLAFTSM